MSMHAKPARDRYFNDFFRYISKSGQFDKTKHFIQHGDTSVYRCLCKLMVFVSSSSFCFQTKLAYGRFFT